jgi:hypothetical protein
MNHYYRFFEGGKMRKFAVTMMLTMGAFGVLEAAEAKEVNAEIEVAKNEIEKAKPTELPVVKEVMQDMEGKVADDVEFVEGKEAKVGEQYGDYDYYDHSYIDRMSVWEVVRYAKDQYSHERRNRILVEYTKRNARRISSYDVIELAKATTKHAAHNQCIIEFMKANMRDLSVYEVLRIAKATSHHETHNEVLKRYAKANHHRLDVNDVISLARETTHDGYHNDILIHYTTTQASRLSRYQARRLADATTSYRAHDRVMDTWSRYHYNSFSRDDFYSLSTEAMTKELQQKFKHSALFGK